MFQCMSQKPNCYCYYYKGGRLCCMGLWPLTDPLPSPPDDVCVNMEYRCSNTNNEKPKNSRRTCSTATMSISNPIYMLLGVYSEKSGSNRLSYCNRWGDYSLESHGGGQSMWDLWWTKWQLDLLFLRLIRSSSVNIIPLCTRISPGDEQ
jgi:hypothetical protein